MQISPQVMLFVLFMIAVVQATKLDERRQRKREQLQRSDDRVKTSRSA